MWAFNGGTFYHCSIPFSSQKYTNNARNTVTHVYYNVLIEMDEKNHGILFALYDFRIHVPKHACLAFIFIIRCVMFPWKHIIATAHQLLIQLKMPHKLPFDCKLPQRQ